MARRLERLVLWLIALAGLGVGAASFLKLQSLEPQVATVDDLEARDAAIQALVEQRIAALTAPDAVPIINAARLEGLTSNQLIRGDTQSTGHFNCLGIGMQPGSSGMAYASNQEGRYMTSGAGLFDCLVHLPNGATIDALTAAVKDSSPEFQAACYLLAISVGYPNDGYSPAFTAYSGGAATPGDTVLEDRTIQNPVVDNTKYAYMAECSLDGPGGQSLVLKGVSIEYTVTGLPID